ncbi:hypothetical protein B0J18DRAFT_40035 [Chaetomium sp. MPI-SDFR-AT-0129]|nr:hypothetical protein B0J18DRAFT_40035 [Chaetomium sp. MPI-SDFR-AT-0129]
MRLATLQAAVGSAGLLLAAHPASANPNQHRHAHVDYARRHGHNHDHIHGSHSHQVEDLVAPAVDAVKTDDVSKIVARKPRCTLPDDPDLVYVPGKDNNGFAMSPDQPCEDGSWCPLACVPGKMMAQWKPHTTYNYPDSMYGGIFCKGGEIEKSFDGPYCMDGTGAVNAVNEAGKIVSFCQTVLPGNEAMLIPTDVTDTATLAVPGPSYWANTSAHYYINPPGVDSKLGCIWGVITEAIGNWAAFVAGANTMSTGETFVKIAWNPEYLKTPLTKKVPTYGLRIECPGGGCNGMPCVIDPSKGGVNGLDSPSEASGVGDANFCVVTVPKGGTANIVVFNTDGSGGDDSGDDDNDNDEPKPDPSPSSEAPKPPKPTKTPPKPTSHPPTTTASPTSSDENDDEDGITISLGLPGGVFQEKSAHGDTTFATSGTAHPTGALRPATTAGPDSAASTIAPVAAPSTSSNEGGAAVSAEGGSAIAGLVVALVAAAALF